MANSWKKEGWNTLTMHVSELPGGDIMLTLPTTMCIQEYPVLYQLLCFDKGPALETSHVMVKLSITFHLCVLISSFQIANYFYHF